MSIAIYSSNYPFLSPFVIIASVPNFSPPCIPLILCDFTALHLEIPIKKKKYSMFSIVFLSSVYCECENLQEILLLYTRNFQMSIPVFRFLFTCISDCSSNVIMSMKIYIPVASIHFFICKQNV